MKRSHIADVMKEAREYNNWVLRDAPLKELDATERSDRKKYEKSGAELWKKYSPIYDDWFKKNGKIGK